MLHTIMGGSAFQWMLHSHAMGGELHSRDTEDILGKVASAHEGGGSFGGGIVPKNRGNLVTEAETVCNQLLKSLKDPHPTHSGKPTATISISGHSSYPQFRTCTCMHYTFNDIKSFSLVLEFGKKGRGVSAIPSFRDCRIFVIF